MTDNSNVDANNPSFLNLSLSTTPPPAAPAATATAAATRSVSGARGALRRERRRSSNQENITPPYPWATAQRARVHSLFELLSKGLNVISGRVQCKKCDKQFDIEYEVQTRFRHVAHYIMMHRGGMHTRAPVVWTTPTLPDCKFCGQHNCAKPVVSKKRSINWLFLFLGQMLGCLKISELKYFCKHTGIHRTGAKDRVLYSTYLEIYRQLDPLQK